MSVTMHINDTYRKSAWANFFSTVSKTRRMMWGKSRKLYIISLVYMETSYIVLYLNGFVESGPLAPRNIRILLLIYRQINMCNIWLVLCYAYYENTLCGRFKFTVLRWIRNITSRKIKPPT
jgi:hypothetical protein